MSKKKDNRSPFVYSTDPSYDPSVEETSEEKTLAPHEQLLRVTMENKHRAGKTVTLITGFVGLAEDMVELGKQLKNHCGSGGTAKDGEIILQGDHREKVRMWLQKNSYRVK
ncbi:MAG: translation initiation factor [bacterium]